MAEVKVNLGEHSYSIYIGAGNLSSLGSLMKKSQLSGKVLVVSDEHVGAKYGEVVLASLGAAGFSPEIFLVKQGEDSKSLEVAMSLYTKAISLGLDRKSPIVALGGGVVGDLTGFIAATYLRGVPFVQIPTSLLAQVDSSVGGKVAVNHPLGKNLIGAFYQPRLVLIDTDCLCSLPERELSTGLAEVIKYGIIADSAFFYYLLDNYERILHKETDVLAKIISTSCASKAKVVEQDEKEASLRMILNFGHTIAHAIEIDTNHKYNHGEAVAIGMHGAALLSVYMGLCSERILENLCVLIKKFKLPLTAPECLPEALLPYFARDKKTVGGKTKWILVEDIGQVSIRNDVLEQVVQQVLEKITC
ncbi:MAG: 3-dehydroquinate synthase [Pelosinus sp.]|nr:3-dehydroquinate synthase [Pelosinus sp.]